MKKIKIMKLFKIIFFICITATLSSCGDSDDGEDFTLSNTNIAGTYEMNAYRAEKSEDATSSSGSSVNLSKTVTVGDTFQLNLVLSAAGTYTASGQYRTVATITPNGENSSEESKIVVVDVSGTYQLNAVDKTLVFNPQNDDFFKGLFTIKTFNENSLRLEQENLEVDGSITNTTELKAGFTKN